MFYDIRSVWFDLSYGGLTVSLKEVYSWDYDTIYYMLERMEKQKEYEKEKTDGIKSKVPKVKKK